MPNNQTELSADRREALIRFWEERSLTDLADHIEMHYHARAREIIPEVVNMIARIQREVPNDVSDLLLPLKHLSDMLTIDLDRHVKEEEEMLFPYIREMEKRLAAGTAGEPHAGHKDALKSLGRIHDEHDQIMDSLVGLKVESTLCRLPLAEEQCSVCRPLYDKLAIFAADLQEHVILEDQILFPGALELEKRIRFAAR